MVVAEHPMNPLLKRAAFGLLVIVFVIAAVLVANLPEPAVAAKQQIILPDGRVLRVEAVTVGTSHVYRTGPEWLEKVQRGGPRWLRDKLGPEVRTMRHTTPRQQVLPWISVTKAPGVSADWDDLHVVAESGEVFDINSRSFPGSFKDRRFVLPRIAVLPRRDAWFSVTGKVDQVPFSVRLKNPLHGRIHPEWTPTPLPATNRVGGFDIVLAGAELSRTQSGEYFSTRFKAFKEGRFLDGWFNYSWELSDATGNAGYILPTNEPAWRVDVKLSRTFAARWATNEYREFTLTNLPAAGELREFNVTTPLGGVEMDRVWIAGPGEYVMENGVFAIAKPLPPGGGDSWSSSSSGPADWEIQLKRRRPWIMIQRRSHQSDHTAAAFVTDGNAAEIRVSRRGSTGTGAFYGEIFELHPPKESPSGPFTLRVAGEPYLRTSFTFDPDHVNRVDRRPRKK